MKLLHLLYSIVCVGRVLSFSTTIGQPSMMMRDVGKLMSTKNDYDVCVIGTGISGLSCAIDILTQNEDCNLLLLESKSTVGGRVSSDYENGFTFDRGYAVFVEDYPQSKEIFDYSALKLKSYSPGALIKQKDNEMLSRIADPLRQPSKLFAALTTSVGSFSDKLRLAPLFYYVKTNSVEDIFNNENDDMDTLTCLKTKYNFSDKIIREFFDPFLVGIYFAPLEEQSSKMFHFVFKMFADGKASLPTGGMQTVSNQLYEKACALKATSKFNHMVNEITELNNEKGYGIKISNGDYIASKSVICATEGDTARKLLSNLNGLDTLKNIDPQPQLSVGSVYYSFEGQAPVTEPILILNGEGIDSGPALTVSFLENVNDSYAPQGYSLCSISIPSSYMQEYEGEHNELDLRIRRQLSEWWPDFSSQIMNEWKLEKIYNIKKAQPRQYGGPQPANVNGGRDPSEYFGQKLPHGVFVCGDHMATSTLNGAIESGRNAAKKYLDWSSKM